MGTNYDALDGCHLVLFLSRATPLEMWDRVGIFTREIALYQRLRPFLGQLSIVTSGGPDEMRYQAQLGDIQILYNRWRLPATLYSLLAPWLHGRVLREATVYKTNQLDGAWTAALAAWRFNKPLIVRAGYLWADFGKNAGAGSWKTSLKQFLQRFALRKANAVTLTTEIMKQRVIEEEKIEAGKIRVFPNYVDTGLFRPDAIPDAPSDSLADDRGEKVPGRICFVGRLEPQKNLHMLIEALAVVTRSFPAAHLVCIGDGALGQELSTLAQKLKVNVEFRGRVANALLPVEINRSEVFVLPSLYEGHPKSLIEAMACGAAMVGTRVTGIQEVVRDGETGLLCATDAQDIARALQTMLGDAGLRERVGAAARHFAEQEYSLDSVVQKELALLRQLCSAPVA